MKRDRYDEKKSFIFKTQAGNRKKKLQFTIECIWSREGKSHQHKSQGSNSINQTAIKVIIINFSRCVHINLYQSVSIVILTLHDTS